MNAPAQVASLDTSAKLAANQTFIRGRILEVKRTENAVYSAVTLPAPDSYSKPQIVEVRSARLLGKPNEDIAIRCAINGYRRSYKDSHGETQYATNMFLVSVED